MNTVITDIAQVTPEWLTDTLKRAGVLYSGWVAAVDTTPVPGRASYSLVLTYSDDAADDAPRRLFLKLNDLAIRLGVPGLGKKEVEFYNAIAGAMADLPVPRCYDAVYSDAADRYHLLLDDLSATHFAVRASQLPPTVAECEQIVDALAQLHAFWWEHPKLGNEIGARPTAGEVLTELNEDAYLISSFIDFLGDRLSPERRQCYEKVCFQLMPLWKSRLEAGKPFTLIFEDVHIGNFLYPHDPAKHRLVIIDWEQWGVGVGANDLAYMMAVFWFPERRARLEQPLLKRYYQRLVEGGIQNYTWDDCWYDYRLAVINHLRMPAWRWAHDSEKRATDIWWNHLERLMLAYDDLGCAELLS